MSPNRPPSLSIFARSLAVVALFVSGTASLWLGCASGQSITDSSSGGGSPASSSSGKSSSGTGKTTSSASSSNGGAGGTGGATSSSTGSGGCNSGEKECNGKCVKLDDPDFGCTMTSCTPCADFKNAMATCMGNTCTLGKCNAGFENCNGDTKDGCETNTSMDPAQCGACGHACVTPDATPACVGGKCQIATCDPGYTDCNMDPSDGCEAQLQTDPQNCGKCQHACGVGESCQMGMCGDFCPPGLGDCNNNPGDGCETTLGTDQNCSACGDACNLPNATADCESMQCTITLCDPDWVDCDMMAKNGCEANTQNDSTNCGKCGNVCPSGPHSTPTCVMGVCQLVCDQGYGDCNNDPTDGCEDQTDTDTQNCGTCKNVCTTQNGTPGCTGGKCTTQSCNPGFGDCDGDPKNGCEDNTSNGDPSNCGACGTKCPALNDVPACTNSQCTIGMCAPGFSDCDKDPKDGCEVNTQSGDPNNCGACGVKCTIANGTGACMNGMCVIGSCNTGFADCDMNPSNGCETNIFDNDPNNCGSCGKVCNIPNGAPGCMGGQCTIAACNMGFTDCDNSPVDGCEKNTANDPLNCGTCNHQCFVANGSAGCQAGLCTVSACNPGFADCNGLAGDGCETTIGTTSNCAGCGDNCNTDCIGNVTATQCKNNACEVLACANGDFDIDGKCADGCECKSTGTGASCPNATSLGTLSVGQSISYSGNLVPLGQEAWLLVTFSGNTNINYHPHINMTAGVGEFLFDLYTNCSLQTMTCGVEGGSSTGRTEWETVYTAGNASDTGFIPIPPVGTNGEVYIHIYRAVGKPVSCNSYTLQVSN